MLKTEGPCQLAGAFLFLEFVLAAYRAVKLRGAGYGLPSGPVFEFH